MALSKLDSERSTLEQQMATDSPSAMPRESAADEPQGIYLPGALRWLDGLIERAVARAQIIYGADAAADPYRGLYISQEEVDRLLAREPGAAMLYADDAGEAFWEEDSPESYRF